MKRDRLEEFILENRESFDDAIPSLKVWAGIDRNISARSARRISLWRGLRIAAAVIVLLLTGAVVGRYISESPSNEPIAALENIAPEFAETARYYEDQIDQKEKQLASFQQGDAVLEDIKQIDQTMQELREELLHAPKGQEEQIIQNLIKTYQTKVNILERVLERIQPNNNSQQPSKPAENEVSI